MEAIKIARIRRIVLLEIDKYLQDQSVDNDSEESDCLGCTILNRIGKISTDLQITCDNCYCFNCRSFITSSSDLKYCNDCHKPHCSNCANEFIRCVHCNNRVCKQCTGNCNECDIQVCSKCVIKCSGDDCATYMCQEHAHVCDHRNHYSNETFCKDCGENCSQCEQWTCNDHNNSAECFGCNTKISPRCDDCMRLIHKYCVCRVKRCPTCMTKSRCGHVNFCEFCRVKETCATCGIQVCSRCPKESRTFRNKCTCSKQHRELNIINDYYSSYKHYQWPLYCTTCAPVPCDCNKQQQYPQQKTTRCMQCTKQCVVCQTNQCTLCANGTKCTVCQSYVCDTCTSIHKQTHHKSHTNDQHETTVEHSSETTHNSMCDDINPRERIDKYRSVSITRRQFHHTPHAHHFGRRNPQSSRATCARPHRSPQSSRATCARPHRSARSSRVTCSYCPSPSQCRPFRCNFWRCKKHHCVGGLQTCSGCNMKRCASGFVGNMCLTCNQSRT